VTSLERSEVPLGTAGDLRVVQFPHPGREHAMPASGHRQWKLGTEPHGRTFLLSPATFRWAPEVEDQRGEVAFWGEWEGAANLVAELEPGASQPRWLCAPDPSATAPVARDGQPPQNTDPYVWGAAMRYAFCRQPRNRKLRNLGRGSVILFGSSLGHEFVLDTVLVVAGWIEHRRRADLVGRTDANHTRATIEPMYGWGEDKRTYRLYVGATPDAPVDGMFSFVPCRPDDGAERGFARPALKLGGLINPNARMQARMLDTARASGPELWRETVETVQACDLALATRLEL
jgi:hypothetical protein